MVRHNTRLHVKGGSVTRHCGHMDQHLLRGSSGKASEGGGAFCLGEEERCDKCDQLGHTASACPNFPEPRRQEADAKQPSPAEIANNVADGSQPVILIKATLVVMNYAGLDCFYNCFVAALATLGIHGAPKTAAALRKRLAKFVLEERGTDGRVVVGPSPLSGETLAQALAAEGSSLDALAQELEHGRGTVAGTGGTIICAVACACFGVQFYGYRRRGKLYERQDLLTQCAGRGAVRGSVHARFIPVRVCLQRSPVRALLAARSLLPHSSLAAGHSDRPLRPFTA